MLNYYVGASPNLLANSKGKLYGTGGDGAFGYGAVYELSPPATSGGAWTETILYSFKGGTDGAYPQPGLVADSRGNIYGTTTEGGTVGDGTVFELTGTGFVTEVPFAAFKSNLELQFGKSPNTGAFELLSEFTIGNSSSGFDLITDTVTLTIGSFTATIPPDSFKGPEKGPLYFTGRIDGADLQAAIAQTGEKRFEFAASAQKADLSGTTNPVPVTLTIGSNTGTDSIRRPERGW